MHAYQGGADEGFEDVAGCHADSTDVWVSGTPERAADFETAVLDQVEVITRCIAQERYVIREA
jgi:hypothetical protein